MYLNGDYKGGSRPDNVPCFSHESQSVDEILSGVATVCVITGGL